MKASINNTISHMKNMSEQEVRIADLSKEERQKLAEKALKAISGDRRKVKKRRKGKSVRES